MNFVIHSLKKSGGEIIIDFQETIGGPVGFGLLKSTILNKPVAEWERLFLAYITSAPDLTPGWRRFKVPFDVKEREAFYRIEAFVQP